MFLSMRAKLGARPLKVPLSNGALQTSEVANPLFSMGHLGKLDNHELFGTQSSTFGKPALCTRAASRTGQFGDSSLARGLDVGTGS